jgi:transcriptional regulator with XRE-family HTH domain
MSMGQRLICERKKRGWTAYTLAKQADVSQSIIHYLEHETRDADKLSAGTVKKLARALGVSADYLMGMYADESGH